MAIGRTYIELFNGLPVDDRITDAKIVIDVGGYAAYNYPESYHLVMVGRRSLNSDDLVTLAEEPISLPVEPDPGDLRSHWRRVTFDVEHIDDDPVRCLVLLMVGGHSIVPSRPLGTYYEHDQAGASIPPWGFRIIRYNVWASDLRRNVTPERIVEDIVSPYWPGERFFCPDESGVTCDQLCFESLPMTRLDALLQVDEMLDWDMEATETSFTYRKPPTLGETADQDLYAVSLADPHYAGRITPATDECFNGGRINYTNRNERPKELVEHWESEYLGTEPKTGYWEMPEAIRSKKQAQKMMRRVKASYAEPPIAGSASFKGTVPVASGEKRDCLLMKPGELLQVQDAPRTFRRTEREISRVTLHPLTREAEVEMDAKSRRIDKVLARIATRRPLS